MLGFDSSKDTRASYMGFGPRMAHLIRSPGYGSPKYRSVVDQKKI